MFYLFLCRDLKRSGISLSLDLKSESRMVVELDVSSPLLNVSELMSLGVMEVRSAFSLVEMRGEMVCAMNNIITNSFEIVNL